MLLDINQKDKKLLKKVAIYSNSSIDKTGFGKHARILLQELNKSGYDAFEMAAGKPEGFEPLQSLPWRAYGLTPTDPKERETIDKFFRDNPGYDPRALGYGNFGIEKVILNEKPDVIIAIEDSWAWPGLLGRPIYHKNPHNWIFWCPQDSLPITSGQKEFASSVKNFAVKAPFAQEEFEKEGIKTMFWKALSDFSKFKPDRKAGLQLRRGANIEDDALCFGFVFRNQLRKLVYPLIEGFKVFSDENPDARLVFHTHPKEGHGSWDIPEIVKSCGLDKNKVLFTKFCNRCKKFSLGPAMEKAENCSCGHPIAHPTPDIGISEEQLNVIYNAFDGYIHPANSGGAEFPVAEAIHAGVPTATVDYAYGKMYPVYKLPFNYYEEVHSLFKKARPTPEGITEFMNYIKDLSKEERKEVGSKGREWALDYFDIHKTCREVIDYIETLPAADYDWKFPCLNPPMPQVEDNKEWMTQLHLGFFGAYPPDHFSNQILEALNNNISREDIYKRTQELIEQQPKPVDPKSFFKDDGKKRLLVGLEHNPSDCLVLLSVLDQLREKYPADEWGLYLMTAPQNFELFAHLDYLDGLISSHEINNTYFYEGSKQFEKLVDIFLQPFKATNSAFGWSHNGHTL